MKRKIFLATLTVLMVSINTFAFGDRKELCSSRFESAEINRVEISPLFAKPSIPKRAVARTTSYVLPIYSGKVRIYAPTPDELDDLLQQDPDVQALIAIREEMTQRAIDRNASISALKTAYQNKDEEQILTLMGYTNTEVKDLHYRLDTARIAILDKFPEVGDLMKQDSYGNCGYNQTAASCGSDRFFNNFSTYSNSSLRPVTCRYGPYIAHLLLCTLGGPFWYWPCAYTAVCSWCTGGWVDNACGN